MAGWGQRRLLFVERSVEIEPAMDASLSDKRGDLAEKFFNRGVGHFGQRVQRGEKDLHLRGGRVRA